MAAEGRWPDGMSLGNNKQVFDPVGFVIRADGVCRLKKMATIVRH